MGDIVIIYGGFVLKYFITQATKNVVFIFIMVSELLSCLESLITFVQPGL